MSVEDNKHLVRRLVDEAVNARNLDVLEEVADGEIAAAARRWIGPFQESFPDFTMKVVDLIAEGDRVVAYSSVQAPMKASGAAGRRPADASRTLTRSTSFASRTVVSRRRRRSLRTT